jgi:hypothetical protein
VDVQNRAGEEAMEMLQSLGVSRDEVRQLYDGDKLFRSRIGQEILYLASRFWQAQKTAHTKKAPPPVRHVMKPGSSEDRIADRVEKLPDTMSAREAARVLANRRARR